MAARSMRAGLTITVGRGLQLLLQLVMTMLLARLLTPDDFGVQGMVFPVALLVQGIANTGLQTAVIQHQNLTDADASAIFWAALPRNALLCAGMAAVAPLLAWITGDARFTPVAIAWAAVLFVATLSAVHEARLKREFRFGAVLTATLIGLIVSVGVALMTARAGWGYWSFVIQIAVAELGRVLLVWWFAGWRPAARVATHGAEPDAVHDLRATWRHLSGARVLQWATEQGDRLVAAVAGGTPAMGLYDAGKRWGTFAFQELHTPLTDVALASLAGARDQHAKLRRAAQQAFLPVLAIALPILTFVALEPRGTVLLVQGPQFEGAAPMLRAIAIGMIATSLSRLAAWVTVACGQADRQFRWMRIATPLTLIALIAGARWGVEGVAYGLAVANIALMLPGTRVLLAETPVTLGDVLPVWLMPMGASLIAAAVSWTLRDVLPSGTWSQHLLSMVGVFGVTYVLVWLVAPAGRRMLTELLAVARRRDDAAGDIP